MHVGLVTTDTTWFLCEWLTAVWLLCQAFPIYHQRSEPFDLLGFPTTISPCNFNNKRCTQIEIQCTCIHSTTHNIFWMLTTLGRFSHFHTVQYTKLFLNLSLNLSLFNDYPIASELRKVEPHYELACSMKRNTLRYFCNLVGQVKFGGWTYLALGLFVYVPL